MISTLATITVLTFNFWGLPDLGFRVLSPLRAERAQALCDRLRKASKSSRGWDVVLLEEVWVPEDRELLHHCGYAYVADRDDATLPLDSGLLILSRYPMDNVARFTFPMQPGADSLVVDGEALARKSGLMARILSPEAGAFWIAGTHLVSDYSREEQGRDRYFELRRQQLEAFVTWARETAAGEPLILGGDWNFGPGSPLWKTALDVMGPEAVEAPGSDAACTLCPPNTMHAENEGKVDHLFGLGPWQALPGSTALTEHLVLPDVSISLSDHWGWQTTFGIAAGK